MQTEVMMTEATLSRKFEGIVEMEINSTKMTPAKRLTAAVVLALSITAPVVTFAAPVDCWAAYYSCINNWWMPNW